MANPNSSQSSQEYEKLVQEIADKIWKMMQKELRDERERRGKDRK